MQPDPGQTAAALRVVVVDADDRVRESLSRLLCIGDRIEVVGTAGQAGNAVEVVLATDPDLVVLDPRLPGTDGGVDLVDRLRAVAPGVRILVMSNADATEGGDPTRLGDGFIRKTFRPGDLIAAVLATAALAAG